MLRLFETHEIRKTTELSGRMWDFALTDEEGNTEQEIGKVYVPHCIETHPGLGGYRGWSRYETTFYGEGNIRLEFKGVSHFARVFVDKEEIGSHYGSYTPFSFCLTNLQQKEHTLRLLVDNAFRPAYALDVPNDYMSYGGITRGVALEKVPDLFLSYVHALPRSCDENWYLDLVICCRNLSDETKRAILSVKIASVSLEREVCLLPGETILHIDDVLVPGVHPWSMEEAHLYLLKTKLEEEAEDGELLCRADDLQERIGFREIRVQGRNILLNGRPVRIKGFCRHEDDPHYGCALPAQAIHRDLQLIKDLGANAVRTSHYPNDEVFLDLCDEMGILVWEENHARGLELDRMKNPHFEEQCEQVIWEMITAHYNHPCICIWGILNECASDSLYGRKCYKSQISLIRHLDQSRPVSFASCKFYKDICQDLVDICSWNIYPYWYTKQTASETASSLMAWLSEQGQGEKPFLISEIGAGAIYGFRDPSCDMWSEELQEEILKKQLTELSRIKECAGMFIWQFCDVRVAKEDWGLKRPRNRNNKGVVDEYRRPKLSYRSVQQIYRSLSDYQTPCIMVHP